MYGPEVPPEEQLIYLQRRIPAYAKMSYQSFGIPCKTKENRRLLNHLVIRKHFFCFIFP